MEQTKIPISIYTEATPNPEALKFVANKMLVPNTSIHFERGDDISHSDLATQLFAFPFVREVFLMNNFVTITKEGEESWYEVMHELRQFIKNFLESDQEVVDAKYLANQSQMKATSHQEDDEVVRKIKSVLDTYVKPAVEMDGGAIEFVQFNDGRVELLLKGACSGCPSSTVTLKQGIEGMMTRMVPEVTEVVSVEG